MLQVQIIPSLELERIRLSDLAGRTATIVSPIETENGCWVELDGEPYCGWYEWYIPYESLMFIKNNKLLT